MEIFREIYRDLWKQSPGGEAYTRQALQMLPQLDQPDILDIGCGSGSQTLELARLTNGHITAIDVEQSFLDRLHSQANAMGLSDQITCLNQSMFDLILAASFDLIWAEGSIYIIGLETGLKQWRGLIKPGGFLVVSELVWLQSELPKTIQTFWQQNYADMRKLEEVLKLVCRCGYDLIGHFTLPDQAWWNYYRPLQAKINYLSEIYRDNVEVLEVIQDLQREIEMYKKYHNYYGYEFIALQKKV